MLCSLRGFDKGEAAQERMGIIKFYEKYEEKATYEAFQVLGRLKLVEKIASKLMGVIFLP